MRHFTDELLAVTSLRQAAGILADAIGEGVLSAVAEELTARARTEGKMRTRLLCEELARLAQETERTSLSKAYEERKQLMQVVAEIVLAESWIVRDDLLRTHDHFAGHTPSTILAWFFLRPEDDREKQLLRRLLSCFRRIEATEPRLGFLESHDAGGQLLMLVEDLWESGSRDEHFATLEHYAAALRAQPSEEAIQEAFSDSYSYQGVSIGSAKRAYLTLLIRRCAERGVAEGRREIEQYSADLLPILDAENDDGRLAALELAPQLASPDSVTLINYWLTLEDEITLEQADQAEHAREIVRIARHYAPAEAVKLAARKRDLTPRHLTRLLGAQSTGKQSAILRRHDDTLRSALALRLLEHFRDELQKDRELSPGLAIAFERTRNLIEDARADDAYGATSRLDDFDTFEQIIYARGDSDRETAIAEAIEENRSLFSGLEMVLARFGEVPLRGQPSYAHNLMRFAQVVDRRFGDDEELVSIALIALDLARKDERLTPVQRASCDYTGGCLLESQGNLEAAVEHLERALSAYEREGIEAGLAVAHVQLTTLYAAHHYGEDWLARVERHGSAALEYIREPLPEQAAVPVLSALAESYAETDPEKAVAYYGHLLKVVEPDSPLRIRANDARASLLVTLGRRDEALDALRTAIALAFEHERSEHAAGRGAMGLVRRRLVSEFLDLLLLPDVTPSQRIEAIEILDAMKGWELQFDSAFNAIVQRADEAMLPPDARANMLDVLQQRYAWQEMEPEFLDEWKNVFREMPAFFLGLMKEIVEEGQPQNEGEEAAYEWFREMLDLAKNASPAAMAEFEKAFASIPDVMALTALNLVQNPDNPPVEAGPPGATWDELQSLGDVLGNDVALATYLVTDRAIHCLIVRHGLDAPAYVQVPIGEEHLRQRYWRPYVREILEPAGSRPRGMHAWQELGELLLKPLGQLLDGITVLYVVPDERLFWLPFHALTVGGRPYCLSRAVVSIPAAVYLVRRVRLLPPPPDRLESVAAIGYTAVDAEREIFEGEARAVASYFSGTFLAGDDASRKQVAALARDTTGLLHISAHGRQAGDADEDPVLYLADGEMTAVDWMSEVRNMVRLCTFSACEVGRAHLSHMKPYHGFPRAALIGGARAVLAPLWRVDAAEAMAFCLAFYEATWSPDGRQKVPVAEGYRRALVARAARPGIDVRDWAAFMLAGDGR